MGIKMDINETVTVKVDKPKINLENLTFDFDAKALKILKEGGYSFLKFDVEIIEENCAQIYNPIIVFLSVRPVTSESSYNLFDISDPLHLTIEISQSFSEYFPYTGNIEIKGLGWIRKSLICKNIEPKIINVC